VSVTRIIYCHGLPGSPEELSAFETLAPVSHIHALDRLGHHSGEYEKSVLAAFDRMGVDEPVTLAGFSLGAMSALHIAAERGALIRKLILISPAAPLELGDFLPSMAGRPVFEAAQAGDWSLRLFTAAQASLFGLAPQLALKTMFRASPDADLALLSSMRFVDVVLQGLRTCLGRRQAAYRNELRAYVRPWAHILDRVLCETEIWSGASDDWTPIAMGKALKARLGDGAVLHVCPGLGHYSTLCRALSQLG